MNKLVLKQKPEFPRGVTWQVALGIEKKNMCRLRNSAYYYCGAFINMCNLWPKAHPLELHAFWASCYLIVGVH